MGEPISGSTVTVVAVATAGAGWWAGLDSGVVIGSFTGAVFFLISSTELKLFARAGYFVVSFFCGVIAAPFVAEVITLGLPGTRTSAPVALGALITAAVAIKFLLAMTAKGAAGKMWGGIGRAMAAAVIKQKETNDDDSR